MAPRDLLLVILAKLTEDGTYYLSFYSVDRDDLKPKVKEYVRSRIIQSCWKLEGHPGENGTPQQRTLVT